MKVRITLTEEALGSAPSNEDLLATYIASKAPTSELSAEEIDNIKAQNAERPYHGVLQIRRRYAVPVQLPG